MPGRSNSGYQPLSQSADVEEEDDVGDVLSVPSVRVRRFGRTGKVDLLKLDNAFKRWTESIAQKVKRKKKVTDYSDKREIYRSVFEPAETSHGVSTFNVKTLDHKAPMTKADYDELVKSVKAAIAEGIHPKMITKGSSGSYFARAKEEGGRVHTVAVFKPKDEEPYGRLNPKTTKWLHRKFKWIIPFGRACLIPNLSYISEAAASLLDERLSLHIVPPTHLVSLSSPAFFYDWIDRNSTKHGKPLPDKIGSMQYFLHGFQDATEFLRKHPLPGRAIADTFDDSNHRHGNLTKRFMGALQIMCGRTGDFDDVYDDEDDEQMYNGTEPEDAPFSWTPPVRASFREELEKLVILDYLMLNTDRGADNYMIKHCNADHEKQLIDVAPSQTPSMKERSKDPIAVPTMSSPNYGASTSRPSGSGSTTPRQSEDYTRRPHVHIAAIDNSLAFPHEHPQGWRSYTYGWLYLPISVIGQEFSQKTRDHFLPLLTSKSWWEETTYQLQKLFSVDPDFHPTMFAKQLAVIKGQAYNIVQSLRHADEGPLELTRRTKCLVWDDELEIPEERTVNIPEPPIPDSSRVSINSVPLPPRRTRSQSAAGGFPPPAQPRSSMERRPVPFAVKFQKVHPGTTGVTVLHHLERLDQVEASLQRLTVDEVDEEEQDVAESAARARPMPLRTSTEGDSPIAGPSRVATSAPVSPFSPPTSPPPMHALLEGEERQPASAASSEEDLVTMSKSVSYVDGNSPGHSRWASQSNNRGLEWLQTADVPAKKIVIVERLETVDKKPLCSCW